MYADGWSKGGSNNADCTSAKSTGCWGHRQVMLGRYGGSGALVAGVGTLLHYLANGALNSDAGRSPVTPGRYRSSRTRGPQPLPLGRTDLRPGPPTLTPVSHADQFGSVLSVDKGSRQVDRGGAQVAPGTEGAMGCWP